MGISRFTDPFVSSSSAFQIYTRVFWPFLIHSSSNIKRFWAILHIQCLRKVWLHTSSLKEEGKLLSFMVETFWVNTEKEWIWVYSRKKNLVRILNWLQEQHKRFQGKSFSGVFRKNIQLGSYNFFSYLNACFIQRSWWC